MAKPSKEKTLSVVADVPAENQVKIAQLQEKFDALNTTLNEKTYAVVLSKEQTSVLMNEIYPTFAWKGYESYAIAETHKQISAAVKKDEIKSSFSAEVIEAVFHFLKSYEGKGVTLAHTFKSICDQFAIAVQEINTDRQSLKDLSLELIAAEKNIDINELVDSLNNGNFQG